MNNLIMLQEGVAVLDPSTADKIADFERKMKEIKAAEDALKESILAEMEEKGILSIKTEQMTISYVGGSDRESFDSKKLRADDPDLYDKYVRMTPVKPSIRIKLNEVKA